MYYFKLKSNFDNEEYVVKAENLNSAKQIIDERTGIMRNWHGYDISMYDANWIERISESS